MPRSKRRTSIAKLSLLQSEARETAKHAKHPERQLIRPLTIKHLERCIRLPQNWGKLCTQKIIRWCTISMCATIRKNMSRENWPYLRNPKEKIFFEGTQYVFRSASLTLSLSHENKINLQKISRWWQPTQLWSCQGYYTATCIRAKIFHLRPQHNLGNVHSKNITNSHIKSHHIHIHRLSRTNQCHLVMAIRNYKRFPPVGAMLTHRMFARSQLQRSTSKPTNRFKINVHNLFSESFLRVSFPTWQTPVQPHRIRNRGFRVSQKDPFQHRLAPVVT